MVSSCRGCLLSWLTVFLCFAAAVLSRALRLFALSLPGFAEPGVAIAVPLLRRAWPCLAMPLLCWALPRGAEHCLCQAELGVAKLSRRCATHGQGLSCRCFANRSPAAPSLCLALPRPCQTIHDIAFAALSRDRPCRYPAPHCSATPRFAVALLGKSLFCFAVPSPRAGGHSRCRFFSSKRISAA